MFDAQVQPILLYGSELWGLNVTSAIEENATGSYLHA